MTKDEIISEIDSLRSIVAMGKDKLKEDQYIDMNLMQEQVDITCKEVAELSPEDAIEVREPLNALMEDLKSYAVYIENLDSDENDGSAAPSEK
ncbi:MAG: hypothetical protein VX430_03005 [Pseudomonadota bacterium]|nr:hypothetical protein [Pseudomonadota bacterium]